MNYVIATGRKKNNVINEYYIIDDLNKYWNVNKNIPLKWDKKLTKNEFIKIYKIGDFYTAYLGIQSYIKGSEIILIKGVSENYFRTDNNKIPEDNLGNLPTLE